MVVYSLLFLRLTPQRKPVHRIATPAGHTTLVLRKAQVHTSTDRQDFNYGQFAVIRRFKDFVWLSHRLEEEFPGIVMPALPVKMLVGKFDQTFVEVHSAPRRQPTHASTRAQ